MTGKTLVAIPTVFDGIEYRSRLEADTAKMLKDLRIPFQYEGRSYLLENGHHYRPDFLLYEGRQVLEVRGYESEKGNAQIVGFCHEVFSGRHGNITYAALMDDLALIPLVAAFYDDPVYSIRRAFLDRPWTIQECWRCRSWSIVGTVLLPCPACRCWMNPPLREVNPAVEDGALNYLVEGSPPTFVRASFRSAQDVATKGLP